MINKPNNFTFCHLHKHIFKGGGSVLRVSLFALQNKTNTLGFPTFLTHTSAKPNINRLFSSSIKKLSFTERPLDQPLPEE